MKSATQQQFVVRRTSTFSSGPQTTSLQVVNVEEAPLQEAVLPETFQQKQAFEDEAREQQNMQDPTQSDSLDLDAEIDIEGDRTVPRRRATSAAAQSSSSLGKLAAYASQPYQSYKTNSVGTPDRDQLILEHLPQVRLIARRIHDRLPESVSLDDLISTGIVGLIGAIDRFDASHNVKLKTYAEYKIRGAILDSLRGLDWAPRQQRKRAKLIEAAIASAEQRLHRTPGEEEIAQELGLGVTEYHTWLVEIRGLNIGSLESAPPDEDNSRDLLRFISSGEEEWPSHLLERSELQRLLAASISQMPEIEKTVLSLYYYEEMTLREISKIVKLHESRISQLKSQAILRLRSSMEKQWPSQKGM